jgi:type IV secretion system protein VirD4
VNEKIRLGYKDNGTALIYPSDGHICLTAPTRSGKTRDFLAAIALTYRGSLWVIDPKAQLACITKRRREQFGRVVMLNPFELFRDRLGASARFNPLSMLDPLSPGFVADCDGIAEGIIAHDTGTKDPHFTDSARQLLGGGIMYLVTSPHPEHEKNLTYLYDQLTREPFSFAREAVLNGTDLVRQRLTRFTLKGVEENREIASVLSTLATQSAFLSIKAIAENLSGSDLDFADLKREVTTVYLTLPTQYIGAAGKWFRLIVGSALKALLREPEPGDDVDILGILDEFSNAVGRLSIVESAMSLAAGYGLQLLPVLQDLNQIRTHYPDSWESFLGNSAVQIYYAPRDHMTADYISKLSGEEEIQVPSVTMGDPSGQPGSSGVSQSWGRMMVPVQRVMDALRLPNDKFFCFHAGEIIVYPRKHYHCESEGPHAPNANCSEFHGMYDPDPYYRG